MAVLCVHYIDYLTALMCYIIVINLVFLFVYSLKNELISASCQAELCLLRIYAPVGNRPVDMP